MISYNFTFILIHISTLSLLIITYLILKTKNKSQIHYAFLSVNILELIWNIGILGETYTRQLYNYTEMIFVNISYIGICFMPITILFLGLVFARTQIKLRLRHFTILFVPIITTIIIWTNDYHNLFFINYSIYSRSASYGVYYYLHSAFSYICIFIGLSYLLYFSVKNSGFFSRQSALIFIGISLPLIVNLLFSFNLANLTFDINSVAFTFASVCFVFAILKFDFLNVVPIALQRIVDLISDSYIVINQDFGIIDYNQTLLNTFSNVMIIKRKVHLEEILSSSKIHLDKEQLFGKILVAKQQKESITYEVNLTGNEFNKYFDIEITPIYSGNSFLGSIILFKDISEHKKNIEIIKSNQEIIMEQERLASLGQLIGGIAHNLKTPIMSLAGGIEALKDLTNEYKDSISDSNVTHEDHYEIAREMQEWLEKMKPYCSYMTDIISAVKGQAVQMNYSGSYKFTIEDLVKRIGVLMNHELKKYHCIMKNDFQIDLLTEIRGEINSLVQVFDNIIINAVQAYEKESGIIEFHICKKGINVEFIIKDYGKGIPKEIQSRLFKEMLTTKGKNGTGLGLYMSYSTIKGRFSGNIRFETEENCGTTFIITIPYIDKSILQEA